MMKQLLIIALFIPTFHCSQAQSFWSMDWKDFHVSIQNSHRQKVGNAEVRINGIPLEPCKQCPNVADQTGYYVLKNAPFKNEGQVKVWLEVDHPDYQAFRDSVYIFYDIYISEPDVHYWMYIPNPIPIRPSVLRTLVRITSENEYARALKASQGTEIAAGPYCPPDKFHPHSNENAREVAIVEHANFKDQKQFRKHFVNSGTPLHAESLHGFFLTGKINVSFLFQKDLPDFEKQLKSLKSQGLIEDWTVVPSPSDQSFVVIQLPNEEISNGYKVIQKLRVLFPPFMFTQEGAVMACEY